MIGTQGNGHSAMPQGKDKGQLVAAVLMVLFGLGLLWRREASYFGAGAIEGTQAIGLAVVCLAFSAIMFFAFFRKR